MASVGSYWRWLGHRLRLSQAGRAFFTAALLVGVAEMVVARAHGDREGGTPLVVLALLLVGVVTWTPSAAESSPLFVVSAWTVGSGVVPERSRTQVVCHALASPSSGEAPGQRAPHQGHQ
jgi:hypothetical protein